LRVRAPPINSDLWFDHIHPNTGSLYDVKYDFIWYDNIRKTNPWVFTNIHEGGLSNEY